ncbi:MAG: HPr family phosphocarrier protein [Synergistaceae bacterium]|jgi:phosphocarrier protein|nr:HPr family phosphocarrier protein [Synergistaceae bacterium]
MEERETTVINETGLHARPASDFVILAKKFESKLWISKSGEAKEVDAKSIVHLLTLGVSQGTKIKIRAEGPDEAAAVASLIALIDVGFEE